MVSFAYGDIDIKVDSIKDGFFVRNEILTDLGVATGDRVLAINGKPVDTYSDIRKQIIAAESITIENENGVKEIVLPEDFLGKLSDSDDRSFFELRFPFVVDQVVDSSLNKSVDLKNKDVITAVNGQPLKYFDEVENRLKPLANQTIEVDILRDNQTLRRQLKVNNDGKLGIVPGGNLSDIERLNYYNIVKKEYGFFESFGVGLDKFIEQVSGYGVQLKKIFNPSTGAYKGVGGFKAIYDIFPDSWSWEFFWGITAFLSIMLGVLNLLPIPALDGGHVMFLMFEIISGKKPSEKFLERAQVVGFFILITLVVFANGNDIFKAIFK
jgi:regulator of sigma E protease